ncbi:hypothetical protein L2E82_24933 [Cichorium intybus]|uniref:Uncharacterized protein n=1 Tax=Cichorium intybus TaxID=13427 RepID=A0ACB9E340_CICIN|nr:hypothetical protein L2E82_24933 [Cichorium intybus]
MQKWTPSLSSTPLLHYWSPKMVIGSPPLIASFSSHSATAPFSLKLQLSLSRYLHFLVLILDLSDSFSRFTGKQSSTGGGDRRGVLPYPSCSFLSALIMAGSPCFPNTLSLETFGVTRKVIAAYTASNV